MPQVIGVSVVRRVFFLKKNFVSSSLGHHCFSSVGWRGIVDYPLYTALLHTSISELSRSDSGFWSTIWRIFRSSRFQPMRRDPRLQNDWVASGLGGVVLGEQAVWIARDRERWYELIVLTKLEQSIGIHFIQRLQLNTIHSIFSSSRRSGSK